MLYSPRNKVGHILCDYNIKRFDYDYNIQSYSCILENLRSGIEMVLDCDKPLYNILYVKRDIPYPQSTRIQEEEVYRPRYDSAFYIPNVNFNKFKEGLIKAIFNTDYFQEDNGVFYNKYLNNEYYRRYKTINHGEIFSNEYLSYYTKTDLTSVLNLVGIFSEIKEIKGKFFIDGEDNLRFVLFPKKIIATNVKSVLFSNFYLFYLKGYQYPQYYIIYTTNDDQNNIKLLYYNSFVESITANGNTEISLSSIFLEYWPNIKDDLNNDLLIDNKFFIVQNILNLGIFLNTPSGIVRYITNEFTQKFFKILFDSMGFIQDLTFRHWHGSQNQYSTKSTNWPYNSIVHTYSSIVPNIECKTIKPLLLDNKIIEWKSFSNLENFLTLSKLTSNADFYNDLIFEVSAAGESLTVPILLTTNI